jgi:predicted RND superfamily exporter protein/predicted LPLAT superfamily acyltransferase
MNRGLNHPGRWLWLFLAVPIAVGLVRLKFDVEIFDLLPPDLGVVQGLKTHQQQFANARELLITVQSPHPQPAQETARAIALTLRKHTNLVSSALWQPPWLEHPEQAAEFMAFLWFNQPPATFAQLDDRLTQTNLGPILNNAREELATSLSPEEIARLGYDPYGLTRLPEQVAGAAPSFASGEEGFSSGDGTFRVVFVKAARELVSYRDCDEWLKNLRTFIAPVVEQTGQVSIGYTGRPAFVAEIARGMERDVTLSVGGTALIIAGLFWLAHKRIKPMLWLLTLLALVLGCTLALGGLIFGMINVVSLGFAAILLGLAVDYAVVHYQEALAHPTLSIPQVRRVIAPSIFWAAVTTISAFLVLNFGGLPGLAQLGTLVGLGVALSACIMIFEFLPPLFPERRTMPQLAEVPHPTPNTATSTPNRAGMRVALVMTGAAVLFACLVLAVMGRPGIDPTADPLRPRNSPAYAALAEVEAKLTRSREPMWIMLSALDEAGMAERLSTAQTVLDRAVSSNWIAGFTLPTSVWPQPKFQAANRTTAGHLAAKRQILHEAAQANGFTPSALQLTDRILDTWQAAAESENVFWPTNEMSRWLFEKFAARTSTNCFALGLVRPLADPGMKENAVVARIEPLLPREGVWLSGWELLGSAIFARVKSNMWKLLVPMALLIFLSLGLAFRRVTEIVLSLVVLSLSGLCLQAIMRLAHWNWNLLNLMAIPLILGTGVDYSIFMQLALRRYGGDLKMAYRSVGRALLLCGGTAMAGFGSLAWSSNAGMASLGQVCAVGVAANMLIAVFLLPVWWHTALSGQKTSEADSTEGKLSTPSSLYRAGFWRVGMLSARWMPVSLCARLNSFLVAVYWRLAGHRRRIVVENLLPALNGDRVASEAKARRLFEQFATKLVDLWRYEAGVPIDDLLGATSGWDYFAKALAEKRGLLLVTPHLGNWELGGPFLSRRGVRLQVITLAEPGGGFTQLREKSRARWDIETLVIGDDPFAFLEIIRRLEGGAVVALLVDRPSASTAVEVELFGRPFLASIAAAELARASGCVLLPVYMLRKDHTYMAGVLPEVPYERASLRERAARQQLTQQIMRTFEPIIRDALDQWYHFVPIWPK